MLFLNPFFCLESFLIYALATGKKELYLAEKIYKKKLPV